MVTLICSISQRMTRDGVKPNERMMETLERAYMLPCRRPILKVRKRTQLLLLVFFFFFHLIRSSLLTGFYSASKTSLATTQVPSQ